MYARWAVVVVTNIVMKVGVIGWSRIDWLEEDCGSNQRLQCSQSRVTGTRKYSYRNYINVLW